MRSVVSCVRPAVDMRRCHRSHRLDIWVPESKWRPSPLSMSIVQYEPPSYFSVRLEPQAQVTPPCNVTAACRSDSIELSTDCSADDSCLLRKLVRRRETRFALMNSETWYKIALRGFMPCPRCFPTSVSEVCHSCTISNRICNKARSAVKICLVSRALKIALCPTNPYCLQKAIPHNNPFFSHCYELSPA